MQNQATKITVQVNVHAPIEHAWKTFTDPDHVMQWNFASPDWHCPYAENDLRIGGKFLSRMAAKDGSFSFDFCGIYDEISLNETITYTLVDDRKVNITFEKTDGGTLVVEVFEAETENSIELQQGGWQAILDNYKAYTESTL